MKAEQLIRLIQVESKVFLREPIALFFSLAFPIMLLFVFGATFGKEPAYPGFRVIDLYVPALIAMVIAVVAVVQIPIVMVEYREAGIFRRLKATPLHPAMILVTEILVSFIVCSIATLLLVVVAKLVYRVKFIGDIPDVLAAYSISCASFFSLGFALSALPPTVRSAHAITMFFFLPMLFLSGASLPKQSFPEALQKIANIVPLTHVVDMLSDLWIGIGLSTQKTPLTFLSAMLILCVLIAVRTFRWE
jgi:ABC-2 type transport system permease protein